MKCYYCKTKCPNCTTGKKELSRCRNRNCNRFMYVEAPFAHDHKTKGLREFDICRDCLDATANAIEKFLSPAMLDNLNIRLSDNYTPKEIRQTFDLLYDLRKITSRSKPSQ